MKHRLLYLIFASVVAFTGLVGVFRPMVASADPSTCVPGLDCGITPISPTNPSGNTKVTDVCPESKYKTWFPTPANQNLDGVSNPFIQCEKSWASSQHPAAYSPGDAVGNTVADYCHRNFTGNYLNSCSNGFGKNGQGSAQAACGDNAACLAGFAVGGNPNQNPNAGGGGGNGDDQPSCEASGFSLSWIFCPIINGLADAVDGIYSNLVQPLLETKPLNLSNPSGDPTHTFEIWSNFRVYGDIFLVIALLVVVFGESISGGLIDAYTAKKILPRLLIAAVLINISIYIVAFAVDITNIIGNGIGSLIQAPFQDAGAFKLKINGSTGDIGMAALVGGGIWAAASLAPLLEFLLLFFLIPAFLTFLAILVTVLLRQGLIIFLVMISPVAFALYCLPNTEQYFRKWWDLLFKTLLIYPLIAIFFALANVLSVTIDSTTSGLTKTFADFVAIIALFVPLFLIPFSFRIAGGVLGRFHEFATNARQRSQEAVKGNANDPDSWRNRTRAKLSQRQSEIGMDGKAMGDNFRAVPGSKTWRENRQARIGAARKLKGQNFLEHDSVAKALQGNDQYLMAVANPKLAGQMRDKAAASGDEAGATSWSQAIASARLGPKTPAIRMAAALQHASTGFQYAPHQEGYNQLAETMADITGAQLQYDENGPRDPNTNKPLNVLGATGPRAGAYADAMDNAQFAEKNAGRWDLAGINRGAGYSYRDGIKKGSGYTAGQGKPDTYIAGAPEYLKVPLQDGKTPDTANLTQQISDNINSGRATTDDVAKWHDILLASAGNPAFGNGDEINKQMKAIEDAAKGSGANANAQPKLSDLQTKLQDNMRRQRRGLDPNLMEDN